MNDPKRLLDDGSDLERDLLGAGARLSAPRGMEARVWRGVGAKLAVGGAVGGAVAATTTKAAASGAGAGVGAGAGGASAGGAAVGGAAAGGLKAGAVGVLAFKTKLVVAALVVASAGTGGALVATRLPEPAPVQNVQSAQNVQSTPTATTPTTARQRSDDAPRVPASAPAENAAPAEAAPAATHAAPGGMRRSGKVAPVAPTPREETKVTSEIAPAPAAPRANEADPAKTEAASQLREDARALQEARTALGAGDPAGAERRLAAISPTTQLGSERDALRVRVAAARGDSARAKDLARAFLRAYPNSPLAPQMTKIVTGSPNE